MRHWRGVSAWDLGLLRYIGWGQVGGRGRIPGANVLAWGHQVGGTIDHSICINGQQCRVYPSCVLRFFISSVQLPISMAAKVELSHPGQQSLGNRMFQVFQLIISHSPATHLGLHTCAPELGPGSL